MVTRSTTGQATAPQSDGASYVGASGSACGGSPAPDRRESAHREGDYVRAVLDCYLWLPGPATPRHGMTAGARGRSTTGAYLWGS
jgi:hypothetical protein